MANQRALTASHIRYLLTMNALDPAGHGVRCVDVATAMNLSKPSVHNMMDTFSEMGLIRKASYGTAVFTEEGHRLAERYDRYYQSVSGLLRSGFPDIQNVQPAVCALLSEIPEENLEQLCARPRPPQD